MIVPTRPGQTGKNQLWQRVVTPTSLATAWSIFTIVFFACRPFGSVLDHKFSPVFCKANGDVGFLLRSIGPNWLGGGGARAWIYLTESYSPVWDPSLFLNVVLGMGEFTFSQAKAIDFFWDLIVGRGGQVYLTYFVYGIVRRSVLVTIEDENLGLDTVTSIWAGQIGPRMLWSMTTGSRTVSGSGRRFAKWSVGVRGGLAAFAIGYVLLFASMTSIMTGYKANQRAYVAHPGTNALVDASKLYMPGIIVSDGEEIGEHEDFPTGHHISGSYRTSETSMGQYYDLSVQILSGAGLGSHAIDGRVFCPDRSCSFEVQNNIHGDVKGTGKNTIVWKNKTFHLDQPLRLMLQYAQMPGMPIEIYPNRNSFAPDVSSPLRFALDDTCIDINWMKERSVCQTLNTYQWGFSSLLLFTFCILTILFAIALAFLQWDIFWHSRSDRAESDPSVYHDILALADEIHHALTCTSKAWSKMSKDELKASMKDVQVRVDVDSSELPLSRSEEYKASMKDVQVRVDVDSSELPLSRSEKYRNPIKAWQQWALTN